MFTDYCASMLQNNSKWIRVLIYCGFTAVGAIIYRQWFTGHIFSAADFHYSFPSAISELLHPSIWGQLDNMGDVNLLLWRMPLGIAQGLLLKLGMGKNISDMFLFFWPTAILPLIAGYEFVYKFVKSRPAAIIGALVFAFNTYYLAILSQGHILLTIAGAFALLGLVAFVNLLEKEKGYWAIISALLLFISCIYDLRVFYIIAGMAVLYAAYFYWTVKPIKPKQLISKWYIFLPLILVLLLNVYWVVPSFFAGILSNNPLLDRGLFGNGFWQLASSITLFHPFWTGATPIWFVTQAIPFYFWLVPIAAFSALFINRKNKNILFFGALALVGIFFTKQVDDPFSKIYPWLFVHVPGFNAFREATKFYFIIAVAYSVLIGSLVNWLLQSSKGIFRRRWVKYAPVAVIALLFLWNTKPLLNGQMKTLISPRNIPDDYVQMQKVFDQQPDYYRVLWLPRVATWDNNNHNHISLDGTKLLSSQKITSVNESSIVNDIANLLKKPTTPQLLSELSVKYIVVPISDPENDDDLFSLSRGDRNVLIAELDKLNYLKRVDVGTKNVIVYESNNRYSHFWVAGNSNVDWQFINSSEYKIRVAKSLTQINLNFSEKYHDKWQVAAGPFSWWKVISGKQEHLPASAHIKTQAGLNSFVISQELLKENSEFTVYFEPQAYLYAGLVVSGFILLGCIAGLLYFYKKSKKHA
jgi:hypothetical protein